VIENNVPSSPNSTIIEEEYIKTNKHNYRMDYLTGPGVLEWKLGKDSIQEVILCTT